MLAQLGNIVFTALIAPESMSDTRTTTYAEHALIENKPRLQRTGEGLQEMQLGMHFHANFCSPEEQYDLLNNARLAGEVLPLVYGTGFYEGDFVILSIQRKVNVSAPDGTYIDITVDITLKEYYDPNKIRSATQRAKRAAFAVNENRPLPVQPTPPTPPSPAAASAKEVQRTNVLQTAAENKLTEFEGKVDQQSSGIIAQGQRVVDMSVMYKKKLFSYMDEGDSKIQSLENRLNQFPILQQYAPQLGAGINTVQSESVTLRNLINQWSALPNPISDVINATIAVNLLKDTIAQQQVYKQALVQMTKYATPINNLVANRIPLPLN